MNSALADQISQSMQQKTTQELLVIWEGNDREQWSDAAFDAIHQILTERCVDVPQQRVLESPPSVHSRWKEASLSAMFAVILFKILSFLGFGGLIPFIFFYGLILLVYFSAAKLIRFIKERHNKK